jgi:MFS family permease
MGRSPLVATHLSGFFSLSLMQMVGMATPLWAGRLEMTAVMIGLASGARSILPLLYSIHFGRMMDVVGVRRFIIFFAAQCAILPVLYPLVPYGAAFLVLQLFLGLAAATVWLAAQTAIARNAGGDPATTGLFSFFTSVGTIVGPLALGFAWEQVGPAGGYGTLALWGAGLFAASLMMPTRRDVIRPPLRPGIFIPRLSSYLDGLFMLKRPVALFVIACTFLRLASVSMLESFYPVVLQGVGFSAGTIGLLFAIGNLASSPSSLVAGWWTRLCGSPRRALTVSVGLSIAAMTVVPAFGSFWMFAGAIAVFGFGTGLSLPLIFTMLSTGIEPDQQGVAAGLRATANRLSAFLLPVVMGIAAELAGVGGAFWIVGLGLLAILVVTDLAFRQRI